MTRRCPMTDEMLGAVHRVSLHVPASPGVLNRCVCVSRLPPESLYSTPCVSRLPHCSPRGVFLVFTVHLWARRSAEVLGPPRGDALGCEHH